ncbi:MAG: exo-alpha-sialidase [Gammaproteobacteria bacterium]|nr:exo-alpha-sialidase [Gammaproteobacteria bacterium]
MRDALNGNIVVAALALLPFAVMAETPPLQFAGTAVRLSAEGKSAAPLQVVAGADGNVYLLWVEKGPPQPGHGHASADDLYVAAWPAAAAGPQAQVRVNATPGEAKSSVMIRARLERGADGTLHVLYPANATSPVNGKPVVDMHYARSRDGGRSFGAPVTLNSPAQNDLTATSHSNAAAAATFPALAVGADNRVNAFWLDSRHVKQTEDPSDVYAATSTDGGATWQPDRRLFGGRVCECCQPVALATADGVLLSSRDVDPAGFRDPIVTRFGRALEPVGTPVRLGTARWAIDGCPMKSTALVAAGGRVYAAWYSHADAPAGVWFATSTDGGVSFDAGRPLHPSATASDEPVLAVAADGTVVAAWHAKEGAARRIYVASSHDGGRSFSTPLAISPAGESAGYPSIAVTAGEAIVAWQQGGVAYALRSSTILQ